MVSWFMAASPPPFFEAEKSRAEKYRLRSALPFAPG